METRKNTLRMVFAKSAKVPAHLDVLKFLMNGLRLPATDVHSVYKDENDQKFYIKLIDDTSFNRFTSAMDEQYVFQYGDGEKARVLLELASRQFKYIRIFNLPPETTEKDITAVLGQFGRIRQHVRERYPAEYGYHVFSGIRGVHMEIEKEIPANVYIGHFRARLYYEGLKNKCFHCKAEGHIKAECPKLASLKDNPNDSLLYSRVTANLKVATRLDSSTDIPSSTMTIFKVPKNRGERSVEVTESNDVENGDDSTGLASKTVAKNDHQRKEVLPLTTTVTQRDTMKTTTDAESQCDRAVPTTVPKTKCGTNTPTTTADNNNDVEPRIMITDDDIDVRKEGSQHLKRPPGVISETDSSDIETGKQRGRKKKALFEQTQNQREKKATRSSSRP